MPVVVGRNVISTSWVAFGAKSTLVVVTEKGVGELARERLVIFKGASPVFRSVMVFVSETSTTPFGKSKLAGVLESTPRVPKPVKEKD